MLKYLRTTIPLLAAAAALATPAWAQQNAKPQESPWAMRAPVAVPQGAPTLSAQQLAAKKESEKGTPAQQELAQKIADAMYQKDYAAMKLLVAPSTLTCIGKHEDFLNDRIKKQFALPISKTFTLTVDKLPSNVLMPSKYSTYPMAPTHLIGIQFQTPGGLATVSETIGQEDGKWYEAQPCPTDLGLQRFAKLQQMHAVAAQQAKAAMPKVVEPVKGQMLTLIAKRDSADAWRLCMSSLKMDFPTCRGIVAILAGDDAN